MANGEQLDILKQGVEAWNNWRKENAGASINLNSANLRDARLGRVDLKNVSLDKASLLKAYLWGANFMGANLNQADLSETDLTDANFLGADLAGANLFQANLYRADLRAADLRGANLVRAHLGGTALQGSKVSKAIASSTVFANLDLSDVLGLDYVIHEGPSSISTDTLAQSKGKIPDTFLKGCGLSDADIEYAKLANPELSNEEINKILYKMYDLRATQAIQISPLFISYSHADSVFVDKVGNQLTRRGIRYWRDIHDMKAGRMEKQIDHAIRQNPIVLLILSEHSLNSDWVEHEVRTARSLEKEIKRDVLCPIALENCWKNSRWPNRVMEQVTEYNILDFSNWKDDSQFGNTFDKLISGLELFYKG